MTFTHHFCSPLSILTPQVTTNLYFEWPTNSHLCCQFHFSFHCFFRGRDFRWEVCGPEVLDDHITVPFQTMWMRSKRKAPWINGTRPELKWKSYVFRPNASDAWVGWKGESLVGSKWMFPKMVGFPPKSSILIGFSIVNHPLWGTPIFGNTHIPTYPLGCARNLVKMVCKWMEFNLLKNGIYWCYNWIYWCYNSLTNLLHVYYFFGHPTHPACHRGLNEDLVRDPQNLEISWYLVVASIASTFLKHHFLGWYLIFLVLHTASQMASLFWGYLSFRVWIGMNKKTCWNHHLVMCSVCSSTASGEKMFANWKAVAKTNSDTIISNLKVQEVVYQNHHFCLIFFTTPKSRGSCLSKPPTIFIWFVHYMYVYKCIYHVYIYIYIYK